MNTSVPSVGKVLRSDSQWVRTVPALPVLSAKQKIPSVWFLVSARAQKQLTLQALAVLPALPVAQVPVDYHQCSNR